LPAPAGSVSGVEEAEWQAAKVELLGVHEKGQGISLMYNKKKGKTRQIQMIHTSPYWLLACCMVMTSSIRQHDR
jgi:hypothetical protein